MGKGKPTGKQPPQKEKKPRQIVFTEAWNKRNLKKLVKLIEEGYALYSALSLVPDPVLPVYHHELEMITRNSQLAPTLKPSEVRVYHAITKARSKQLRLGNVSLKGGKRGRPTQKNKYNMSRVLEAFEAGVKIPAAAACAGVTPQTLRNWLADDKEFLEQCEHARAVGRARLELTALRSATENGGRALDILERLYANDWSKNIKITPDEGLKEGFAALGKAIAMATGEEEEENG